MSGYLEEAAQLLRQRLEWAEQAAARERHPEAKAGILNGTRREVAREFMVLAAIEKGLPPDDFDELRDVLEEAKRRAAGYRAG